MCMCTVCMQGSLPNSTTAIVQPNIRLSFLLSGQEVAALCVRQGLLPNNISHLAVPIKLDAGQDAAALPGAGAWQLSYHLQAAALGEY